MILDINMPGEDGLTLARRLREHSDVCIMMLTAAGEIVDRVVGLEMGADDYIAKPFDLRELLARVRTVLRRRADADARSARPEAPPDTPTRCCPATSSSIWRIGATGSPSTAASTFAWRVCARRSSAIPQSRRSSRPFRGRVTCT